MRTSFVHASFGTLVSLVLAACGGEKDPAGDTSSLSSPLSFPVGVETACSASIMQLSAHVQLTMGLVVPGAPPTVTLTSSDGVVTATVNGTTPAIGPLKLTAISGASASVLPGQTLTVPTATLTAAAPTAPAVLAALPVEGGSINFDGDSFFLSLEMSLQGTDGPAAVAASFECTAPKPAPADCTCPAGDHTCACSAPSSPPLGVYTQCSTDLDLDGSGGGGGDTTVTLAEQNGQLTMTLGGTNPVATGSLDLTPTSAGTATIPGGQSLGAAQASASASCKPGGDLWTPPAWPLSVTSGGLTTDGKWLTVSLVGTSPCSTEERLAIMCAPPSP